MPDALAPFKPMVNGTLQRGLWWMRAAVKTGFGLVQPEISMSRCLRGLVARGFRPTSVVDIGAAFGDWTRLALRYWPNATFTLIEPLVEHTSALNALAARHFNVHWVSAAAGDETGTRPIGIGRNLLISSLAYPGETERLVPVITIDNLLMDGRLQQPDLMKLDVQGYELKVLQGAQKAMQNCALVLVELPFFRFAPAMSLVHEAMAWMAARGFRPYEIVDAMRRPLDGAMGQCDILFVREGHTLLSSNSWNGK